MSASKAMSAKLSASIQPGDSSSLLQTALFVGVAVLVVLLLIFLYNKFVAKKPANKHEYFADVGEPVADEDLDEEVVASPPPPGGVGEHFCNDE